MTSGILYKNRLNGFGTLVLQRTSYITYLKKMIAAQALYIISFMLLFYGILIFISITLFGFGLRGQHITGSLTFSDYSIMKSFFFLFIQLLIQIVFVTLAIILSPLTERIISSSYLLMLTPFFLLLVPFILASILGRFLPTIGQLANYLVVQNYLLSLYNYSATLGKGLEFVFILPVTLLISIYLMAKKYT